MVHLSVPSRPMNNWTGRKSSDWREDGTWNRLTYNHFVYHLVFFSAACFLLGICTATILHLCGHLPIPLHLIVHSNQWPTNQETGDILLEVKMDNSMRSKLLGDVMVKHGCMRYKSTTVQQYNQYRISRTRISLETMRVLMLLSLWQHCSRYRGHIAVFCSIAVLLISIKGRKHVVTLVYVGWIWRNHANLKTQPPRIPKTMPTICLLHP